jgi:ferredoxin
MSFMKVTIDRSGCISCGICESICPRVYRLDDEGLAEVVNQPDESSETAAAQAATDCPTAVIIIED